MFPDLTSASAKAKLRWHAYLRPGLDKPNPLILMVTIGAADTGYVTSRKLITDYITIVPSGKMLTPDGSTAIDKSFAIVSIPTGEFTFDNKQPSLNVQTRLKAKLQNERALFVTAPADRSYGMLENVVYAARAAGPNLSI